MEGRKDKAKSEPKPLPKEEIGAAFRAMRKKRNLSAQAVATKTGTSKAAVDLWETGRFPTKATGPFDAYARFFGVDPARVMEGYLVAIAQPIDGAVAALERLAEVLWDWFDELPPEIQRLLYRPKKKEPPPPIQVDIERAGGSVAPSGTKHEPSQS